LSVVARLSAQGASADASIPAVCPHPARTLAYASASGIPPELVGERPRRAVACTKLAVPAPGRVARQAAGGAVAGADGRYILCDTRQTPNHAAVGRIGQGRPAPPGREDPHNDAGPCASCDARQQGLCSTLGDRDLRRLAEAATVCRALPGQLFIAEGEPSDSFYSVRTGTARLFRSLPDGRRQITGFASSGHVLGLAVTGPAPGTYALSAEAIGATRYCSAPTWSVCATTCLVDGFFARK